MLRNLKVLIILVVFITLIGCFGRNFKLDTFNVQEEIKKSRIKLNIVESQMDIKQKSYFVSTIKNYFYKYTDILVVDDNSYEIIVNFYVSNLGVTLVQKVDTNIIRLDFVGSLDMFYTNSVYVFSNKSFYYTSVTNIAASVFSDLFFRNIFMEDIYNKFLNDVAFNLVYVVSTGWKGSYGYYSSKDGIIQSIFGGSTNEETTRRTNRRNIPTIGGE
ncbi:MAG: hypothetical protein N2712_07535 [Brevinematales bacterium]|nr:hypothetical protein [Brevinematales bacterium]